jgi:pyridoxine 5-phosphate synthase
METARTGINLELAAESEILDITCELRPMQATLVPEKRQEITTEGGLDLATTRARKALATALERLAAAGVRTSLFIDPDEDAIRASIDLGADAIEIHTGEYANALRAAEREAQLSRINAAASLAGKLGLAVHAGHGLTYENVTPVAAMPEIEELNIGHSIVSRAVFTGLERAVRDMVELVRRARTGS